MRGSGGAREHLMVSHRAKTECYPFAFLFHLAASIQAVVR